MNPSPAESPLDPAPQSPLPPDLGALDATGRARQAPASSAGGPEARDAIDLDPALRAAGALDPGPLPLASLPPLPARAALPPLDPAIARARRGDPKAFALLVDALAGPLVRFVACVMRGDVHAAHDVVQETFLIAWRTLPALSDPEHLRAWIYRVAHRRAVSWLRRRGPGGTPFVGLDDFFHIGDPRPAATGAAEPFAREGGCAPDEPAPRLRAVLGSMPPQYAAALTLHYLESLDLRETARVLNVSMPTLKMRLHRGRTMLKRRLLAAEPWVPHSRGAASGTPVLKAPAPPSAPPPSAAPQGATPQAAAPAPAAPLARSRRTHP